MRSQECYDTADSNFHTSSIIRIQRTISYEKSRKQEARNVVNCGAFLEKSPHVLLRSFRHNDK